MNLKKNNEAIVITDAFKRAVDTKNLLGVRIMLKDGLLVDPTFELAKANLEYAKKLDDLFVPHDGIVTGKQIGRAHV